MPYRLILGRAGSGKTHHCLEAIRAAIAEGRPDDAALILLVPEQAALQMERALLTNGRLAGLGRCQVLSFRRLAHRLLAEAPDPLPTPLTVAGRQMVLRSLLARRRPELRECGGVALRWAVVREFDAAVAELIEHGVAPAALWRVAEAARAENDAAADRLHDVALIYEAYRQSLEQGRVDPGDVLTLAVRQLEGCDWLEGARLWVDGFAGLTAPQSSMLTELARRAAHVEVTLLVDPHRPGLDEAPPDDASLFSRTERTGRALQRAMHEAGVVAEAPLLLAMPARRFAHPTLSALEKNLFAVVPRDGDLAYADAAVRVVRCADRRAEVALAVRTLRELVSRAERPLRYRDIAIVVRDLEAYHEPLAAALREHDIPFFLDRRRPTRHHALVELVRAALRLRTTPADTGPTLLRLLMTGLTPVAADAVDRLDNYQRAFGLDALDAWQREWNYPPLPLQDDDAPPPEASGLLAGINTTRREVLDLLAEWPQPTPAPAGFCCRDHAVGLIELLRRFGAADALQRWHADATRRGELDEAQEHLQVWTDMVELLDELVAALGDEPMTAAEFTEVVEAGLAEFTVGLAPATLDQVLVGSIERSRHPAIRAALVLGFCDGLFPQPHREPRLLGDAERERLERGDVAIGPARRTALLDERMLAYIALTRASEFLLITHPAADDSGDAIDPSPYLSMVRAALPSQPVDAVRGQVSPIDAIQTPGGLAIELLPRLRREAERGEIESAELDWLAVYERARVDGVCRDALRAAAAGLAPRVQPRLAPALRRDLRHDVLDTSVTRLESFSRCPYQHFVRYDLALRPRDEPQVAGVQVGRLYHRIMQQFVASLIERGRSLRDHSDGEIVSEVLGVAQVALDWFARQQPLDAADERHMLRQACGDLPVAIARARELSDVLTPSRTELAIGDDAAGGLPALELRTPRGRTVRLRGRVDRVDLLRRAGHRAVVIDYKTGRTRALNLDAVFHGLALQLVGYLLMLRGAGGRVLDPVGAFYVPLVVDFRSVQHPRDRDADDPFGGFEMRGLLRFDALSDLEPAGGASNRPTRIRARRKEDGSISDMNRSDAAEPADYDALLEHVHRRIGTLADALLDGEIRVEPRRLARTALPCQACEYRAVCRFEPSSGWARTLQRLARSDVFEQIRNAVASTESPP